MIITFIGMSGTGKTHWAARLKKKGFIHIHCDELIEEKLGEELRELGYKGIQDVAKWMGQPFYKDYASTSKRYLHYEAEVLREIMEFVKKQPKDANIIIDTTGSVIYLDQALQQELKKISTVIFLDVPQKVKDNMYKLYIRDPKPVIWGDSFKQLPHESNYVALSRCYPKLLEYRTKKYQELAHITLDYFDLRKKKFETDDFLKMIQI